MARGASTSPDPESRTGKTLGSNSEVTLFLVSGETLNGEILSGDGRSLIVGLPASGRRQVPLGQPIGLELRGPNHGQSQLQAHRISVVATTNDEQDGISTIRLVLGDRATIGGTRGSLQTTLFNERAAFRLPAHRDSVESTSICSVTPSPRATRPGRVRASVRGSRFKAKLLDVSFDGLGVLVNEETDAGLKGADSVHLELITHLGKITVEGLICRREELPRGGGVRYGISAGASRAARWRDADEQLLRRFVTEQQRTSLERLRRA